MQNLAVCVIARPETILFSTSMVLLRTMKLRLCIKNNDLSEFEAHEAERQAIPHQPGPLADLFKKLSFMQKLEEKLCRENPSYKKILRIAIITARNAPSHERVVITLKSWGVSADESFFLGRMEKSRILTILKPHMFFDDQRSHLQSPVGDIPMVHVPFGIANNNLIPPKLDCENTRK